MRHRTGFTLAEALVSVAVVGALAAVTAPLYIHSDILEKVARQKMDLAEVEKGLELYRSENYNYPPWFLSYGSTFPNAAFPYSFLTTPVEYVSSDATFVDKFSGYKMRAWYRLPGTPGEFCWYEWGNCMQADFSERRTDLRSCDDFTYLYHEDDSYLLFATGPTGRLLGAGLCNISHPLADRPYDPTNGLVSNGQIMLFGPREATPSPVPTVTPTPTITPTPQSRPAGLVVH